MIDPTQPHFRIALDPEEGTVIVNVQDFDYKDYTFANDKLYETVEEAAADNWQEYEVNLAAEDDISVYLELTADEVKVLEKLVHAFEHERTARPTYYEYAPTIELKRRNK